MSDGDKIHFELVRGEKLRKSRPGLVVLILIFAATCYFGVHDFIHRHDLNAVEAILSGDERFKQVVLSGSGDRLWLIGKVRSASDRNALIERVESVAGRRVMYGAVTVEP